MDAQSKARFHAGGRCFGTKNAARVCAQIGGRAHSGRPRGRMRLRRIGRYAGLSEPKRRFLTRLLAIKFAPNKKWNCYHSTTRHSPISCYNMRCALRALGTGVTVMAEKRKYPIAGTDFFTKIVDEHGYYIDKTDVIPWLLSRSKQVVLFTRPRRFGKSTMMSMFKAFFEYRIDRSNIESNIEYGSRRLDLAVWRKDRAYLLKLKSISLSELKKSR